MSRTLAGLSAGLLLLLPACAGPGPKRIERITAACPLLTSMRTGLFLDSDLVPVESNYGGLNETHYSCSYMREKQIVVDFSVSEFASRGVAPDGLVASISRRSRVPTTPVPGIGEAAVRYEEARTGITVFIAVKRSGPNLRLVSFDAVKPFPSDRLAALASIAMARL